MRREKKQNLEEVMSNDKFVEPQNSFSYDKNENGNQTFQDKNISLNKLNYLSYDKKVKAVHNPNYTNSAVHLEEEKIADQKEIFNASSYKGAFIEGEFKVPTVISPQPKISKESFSQMNNYVKNTFRKGKKSGRKNSHYSYSSHRRKDSFSNIMAKKKLRKGR